MKRILSFLTAMLLVLCAVCCACAEVSYTSLPEKLFKKQLKTDNGLKGAFVISAEGEEDQIPPFIRAVRNAEFELRGIRSGEELHFYLYQTQESDDSMAALQELYLKNDAVYFRSDFLPGKVFSLPVIRDIPDAVFPGGEGGNPSLLPALIRYLLDWIQQNQNEETGILDQYKYDLEMWLSRFAPETAVRKQEDGYSTLQFSYHIPAEALKNSLYDLMEKAVKDENIHQTLAAWMTEEQLGTYLNEHLLGYYRQIIDAMQLENDAVLTRTITLGETVGIYLELPLDQRITGYRKLTVQSDDQLTDIALDNGSFVLRAILPNEWIDGKIEADKAEGWVMRYPATDSAGKDDCFACSLQLNRQTSQYTDEDNRSHETYEWKLLVEQDASRLPDTVDSTVFPTLESTEFRLNLHFFSKYEHSSPTTMEFEANVLRGSTHLTLSGKVKSAAPWVFMPFDISGAEPFFALSDEEKTNLDTQWLKEAEEKLSRTMMDPAAQ